MHPIGDSGRKVSCMGASCCSNMACPPWAHVEQGILSQRVHQQWTEFRVLFIITLGWRFYTMSQTGLLPRAVGEGSGTTVEMVTWC